MSGESSAGEKSHPATEKRLAEARREGDIPKSAEVTLAATYAVLFLTLWLFGAGMATTIAGSIMPLFDSVNSTRQGEMAELPWLDLRGAFAGLILPVAALLLAPFLAVLISLFGQRSFVLVPSRLMPKLNRISPLASIRNRFGATGIFEFLKSLTKLIFVGLIATALIGKDFDKIASASELGPQQFATQLIASLLSFLTGITILTLIVATVDIFWQRAAHQKRLRMSFEELRQEAKEGEGDPHMKAQRHRRAHEIATNRMMLDVPRADVIIVNPLHFAVALAWDRSNKSAPVCVAKGTDAIAARIREAATLAGVPMHRDPPTARSLHATVEIGHEIQPAQYRPVAAAIRFAEKMRKSARERQRV